MIFCRTHPRSFPKFGSNILLPLIILAISILLLILLISAVKLNAYISLLIAALFVGLCNGMDVQKLLASITEGIGSTLGSLVLVLGFGVLLGSILTETGGTKRISDGLIRAFGPARAKYAMVLTGFAVGIALFYNAGFIVLIPVVFAVSAATGKPLVYLAVAMASALSITHGLLPPHPGPVAISILFKADNGKILIYGLIVAIPALLAAGILFPETLKKIVAHPPDGMFSKEIISDKKPPSFGVSLFIALLPVLLMGTAAFGSMLFPDQKRWLTMILFFGDARISLLIAVLLAIILLGVVRGISVQTLMDRSSQSLQAVALIILITGAGGAFKQVLSDSGTGNAIAEWFKDSQLSPLLLGWLVATLIRIAVGSATTAGLTAAGIMQPMVATMHVKPELMVLSIGAGSLMCSHVNDTGFWMFKEYLGLSLKDTFRTWTLMETIIGVTGLCGVLLLNLFV